MDRASEDAKKAMKDAENARLAMEEATKAKAAMEEANGADTVGAARRSAKEAQQAADMASIYAGNVSDGSSHKQEASGSARDAGEYAHAALIASGIAERAFREQGLAYRTFLHKAESLKLKGDLESLYKATGLERHASRDLERAEEQHPVALGLIRARHRDALVLVSEIASRLDGAKPTRFDGEVPTQEKAVEFILKHTKHALQGTQVHESQLRRTTGEGDVRDLHGQPGVVGALLFDGSEYTGLAVPVVVDEMHTTYTKYKHGASKHTRHAVLTVGELETAALLGQYVKFDGTSAYAGKKLDLGSKFLEHMFLDELRYTEGDTIERAAANFTKCTEALELKVRIETRKLEASKLKERTRPPR
jgi:hypothetical protein